MATADTPGRDRSRRWIRLGGPVAVLVVGAAVMAAVVVMDRPPDPPPEPDPVEVDAQSVFEFTTLDDMVAASDLVVRAAVVATERGDLLGADGSDPGGAGVVVREVTLAVDEVWWQSPTSDLAGSIQSGDQLVVAEEGWLASGEPLIVDGLAPSTEGDDAVWFLQSLPGGSDGGSGGPSGDGGPGYLVINSQGRFVLDGGSLTGADGDDALIRELEALSVADLRSGVRR